MAIIPKLKKFFESKKIFDSYQGFHICQTVKLLKPSVDNLIPAGALCNIDCMVEKGNVVHFLVLYHPMDVDSEVDLPIMDTISINDITADINAE